MPGLQDRRQVRSEELFEFPITGPFGGVQSELPLDQIENYGFADTSNWLFRKGVAYVRPGFTTLTPFPSNPTEPVLGIANFYNNQNTRVQVVMTQTRLFLWNSGSQTWTQITGTAFTGSATQLFGWDILGGKLLWSQGADKIFLWDGITAGYTTSSVNAPAAFFLAEIGLHLMAGNTLEGGISFPQRYHWSGIGDPTDWTSFSSGINDNLNNLGPIQGLLKLGQYGYGFHKEGIVQIQPTGFGLAPFSFNAIANATIGNFCPYSLDHFNRDGVECAVYAGFDNIYIFNQSSVIPIGDAPLDGKRRVGARSRIIADIVTAGNANIIQGHVTQNIKGQVFNAYWLIIPNVRTWVYNFDEGNWTDFSYAGVQNLSGRFLSSVGVRIEDLVGRILDQNWTPATLNFANPYDGFAFGTNNGQVNFVDFSNFSEIPAVITSGKHIFGDRRHKHCVKKYRLVVQDQGATQYTITVSNNTGDTKSQVITLGTGSGDSLSSVVEFNITGLRITWTVAVPAGQPGAVIEFCPVYDISGEQRGGLADG